MKFPVKLINAFTQTRFLSTNLEKNIFPVVAARSFASPSWLPIFSGNCPATRKHSSLNFSASKRTLVHTSRYAPVDIPNEDLFSFLTANFPYCESKVVAVDASTGKQCTFQQLQNGAVSLGSALIKRGLQPGDVVGVCAPNCIEFMMAILAVPGVGATVSPINQALSAQEIEGQLKMTNTKFVITTKEFVPVVAEAVSAVGGMVEDVFVIDDSSSASSFASLLADDGSAFPSESERRAMIDPASHVAFIPFSSGTTGKPKGVEVTHRNIVGNVLQCCGHPDLGGPKEDGSGDRSLGLLPMWHIYMLISSLICMRFGTMTCLMPKFEPLMFLKSISEYKLDTLPLVPPLIVFLLEYPELVAKYDLSAVQDIICGAAPLGHDTHARIKERMGISKVRQAWGMSEIGGSTICPATEPLPGSCGVLVPNTELKIVDCNDRAILGEGGEGEIAIRGPNVMKGYLNNPKATREMIDEEGWLYTGDIGRVEANGHLKIVDRVKELIKYKGHQVAPAELEDVLLSHPSIADAAVIGIPVEAVGEVPRAFVKLQAGADVGEMDVVKFVNERVGAFSWLRGGAEFVDSIPKAASGKILRRELRDKYGVNPSSARVHS